MTARIASVLVVDDNEVDVFLARELMRRHGGFGDVYDVADGQEALELFRSQATGERLMGDDFPPTLIILDINMPRMNGFEFLDAFREVEDSLDPVPVVVMMLTSSVDRRDRDRARAYGIVKEFAEKPVSMELLDQVVSRYGR